MPVTHIVWDWNGTLFDDTQTTVDIINELSDEYGIPRMSVDEYRDNFDYPINRFYEKLTQLGSQGRSGNIPSMDQFGLQFAERFLQTAPELPLRDGAKEILHEFNQQGLMQYIYSTFPQPMLESLLARHEIGDVFTQAIGQPHPTAESKLDHAEKDLAEVVSFDKHTLFVGDIKVDAQVAQKLNAKCVLITGGHQSEAQLSSTGVPVISRLEDVKQHV